MQIDSHGHESLVRECLAATLLAIVYLAAEFFWGLLGSEPSLGRFTLATCGAVLTWVVVRATIPQWPLARRLALCLVICVTLNAVAQVRVHEHLARFGTVHAGSDDSFYLKSGNQFAMMLDGAADFESYGHVYTVLPFTPHIGFIVLIGHLFSLVPADDLSHLRTVLLLNLLTLQLLAALVIRLGCFASRQLGLVLVLFLIPGFDLFYYAAEVRKDPLVVLATIALAAGLMSLTSEKATFRRLIAVAAIAAALFFLRNFYTALPAAAIVLTRLRAKRGSPLRRLMVRTAAVCCMGGALFLVSNSVWFQEISLGAALTMKIAEYGWGAQIHNVPVIGPVVYALITPLPPRLTDLTAGVAWTDLLRSVGMLAILVLLAVQSTAAVRTQAVTDKRWRTFLHLGVIVFLLSAYGSLEARHRLAAIPCLMVCYGIVRQRAAAVQAARALSFAASGRRRPPLAPAAIALPSRTA